MGNLDDNGLMGNLMMTEFDERNSYKGKYDEGKSDDDNGHSATLK